MFKISKSIAAQRVLNSSLYAAIQDALQHGELTGELTVKHQGELAAPERCKQSDGKTNIRMTTTGERYELNCPFCGDTRNRLSISYLWGTKDPVTGQDFNWLFRCFNEECQRNVKNSHLMLRDILKATQLAPMANRRPVKIADPGSFEAQKSVEPSLLPRDIVSLSELPEDHPAIRFFTDKRGLDPKNLSNKWLARYCRSKFPAQANNRVLFPIYQNGEYCGYQGRYIGDGDGDNNNKMFCRTDDCHHIWEVKPGTSPKDSPCPCCKSRNAEKLQKWWNAKNTRNGQLLYNLDAAKQWPFVVLCEGPLDTIYVGTPDSGGDPGPAVASFGKSLSYAQIELFMSVSNWKRSPVYLAYDGDVWVDPSSEKAILTIMERLESNGFQVVPVLFPPGKDPGDLPHKDVWDTVRQCSIDYGIQPPF